jgi:hypothetical protein
MSMWGPAGRHDRRTGIPARGDTIGCFDDVVGPYQDAVINWFGRAFVTAWPFAERCGTISLAWHPT